MFAKEGLIERLENEGRNSPADLVLVADVGNVVAAVEAEVTQPVEERGADRERPGRLPRPPTTAGSA